MQKLVQSLGIIVCVVALLAGVVQAAQHDAF